MNKKKGSISDKTSHSMKTEPELVSFLTTTDRLLVLTDGVIAIAITLLAITLIKYLHEEEHVSLLDLGEEFYQYAIGFLALGMYWMLHHHLFNFIKRADGILMWLNIVFLAMASMVPFWTAFNTENLGNPEAIAPFGLAMILTLVSLLIIWLYVTSGHNLVSDDFTKRIYSGYSKIIIFGIAIIAVGTFGGLFSSGIFGIFSLVAAVWFIYMTAHGYKRYLSDEKSSLMGLERKFGLTDAVISIAITLLVLELAIPDLNILPGEYPTGKEPPHSLIEMVEEFFIVGIGFLSLGFYWILHHHIFHYIKRADGTLMWMNIVFLSFASLVPFWVALLTITGGADEVMVYYGVAVTLTVLILLLIWLYASIDYRLVSKDLSEHTIAGFTKFLVFIFIFTLIVIAGSIFIPGFKNVSWIISLILFIYLTAVGYKKFIREPKTDKNV